MDGLRPLGIIGANTPALAKAISGAGVIWQQGWLASAYQGKPFSAEHEIAEGTFQLSDYTDNTSKFSEVVR